MPAIAATATIKATALCSLDPIKMANSIENGAANTNINALQFDMFFTSYSFVVAGKDSLAAWLIDGRLVIKFVEGECTQFLLSTPN